ncbi:MAG: helix-turn-helix domain-containing protein [Kiritimatiellae bacterium]|nr:helix-turn-helix domain-containing protein [Kiritimatiellia bacterium]
MLGTELVKLREAKGLTIEKLSEETHIGPHVLREFEAGDYSRISAAIYGSGFIKILAKYYGVDAAPLRETFAQEYQAWVEAHTALPKTKAPPQKFSSHRAPARPEPAPSRPDSRAPSRVSPSHPDSPAPSSVSAPTSASTQAQGDLFEETPRPTPPPAPTRPDSVGSRPVGAVLQTAPATAVAPEVAPSRPESPAPSRVTAPSRNRTKALSSQAKAILSQAITAAGRIARTPLFQRACAAVLVLAAAAWICTLSIGGPEPSNPDSPAPSNIAVAPQPDSPAPSSVATPTPPAPPAPSTVAESAEPASESLDAPSSQARITIVGSALTDNLLPPPDSYAE